MADTYSCMVESNCAVVNLELNSILSIFTLRFRSFPRSFSISIVIVILILPINRSVSLSISELGYLNLSSKLKYQKNKISSILISILIGTLIRRMMMSTAKITIKSMTILNKIQKEIGDTKSIIIEKALKELDKKIAFEKFNKAYSNLKANKQMWEEELEERKELDGTLEDGLDN